MELIANVKNYDWGKLGSASEVAKLAGLNCPRFAIDESTPYAELWVGDHVNGPSLLKATREDLGLYLATNGTDTLGGKEKLSFLLKVLSIRKALSIQVHPNKAEAELLHTERPDVYKDPNHKPELTIALTPFLALCGFRPHNEIYKLIQKLPPLVELLGAENVAQIPSGTGLRICFEKLMTSSEKDSTACIESISKKYSSVLQDHGLLPTFKKINLDFPCDVGVLSLIFLNLISLQPGQAIYIPANEIHAYLEGDCIEIQACSDNVIRAGLTPKYKDVQSLLSMLNYEGSPPESKLFHPHKVDNYLERYIPPVKEFALEKLSVPKFIKEYTLTLDIYGAILLVLDGERQLRFGDREPLIIKRGSAVFIPGNVGTPIKMEVVGQPSDFLCYIAKYNSF